MRTSTAILILTCLLGLAAPSRGGEGEHVTQFTNPVATASGGPCKWGWTISPWNPDAQEDRLSHFHYSKTLAAGMQVQAYTVATSVYVDGTGISSGSAGQIEVYAVSVVLPCIGVDWKPRCRLRAHAQGRASWAACGAYWKGDCLRLAVHTRVGKAVCSRTSVEYRPVSILSPWGGITVPVEYGSPGAAVSAIAGGAWHHDQQIIDHEWATFSCAVETQSWGSGNAYELTEAVVYESRPGFDLHARCLLCSGKATVVYGWYD